MLIISPKTDPAARGPQGDGNGKNAQEQTWADRLPARLLLRRDERQTGCVGADVRADRAAQVVELCSCRIAARLFDQLSAGIVNLAVQIQDRVGGVGPFGAEEIIYDLERLSLAERLADDVDRALCGDGDDRLNAQNANDIVESI